MAKLNDILTKVRQVRNLINNRDDGTLTSTLHGQSGVHFGDVVEALDLVGDDIEDLLASDAAKPAPIYLRVVDRLENHFYINAEGGKEPVFKNGRGQPSSLSTIAGDATMELTIRLRRAKTPEEALEAARRFLPESYIAEIV